MRAGRSPAKEDVGGRPAPAMAPLRQAGRTRAGRVTRNRRRGWPACAGHDTTATGRTDEGWTGSSDLGGPPAPARTPLRQAGRTRAGRVTRKRRRGWPACAGAMTPLRQAGRTSGGAMTPLRQAGRTRAGRVTRKRRRRWPAGAGHDTTATGRTDEGWTGHPQAKTWVACRRRP